MQSSRSRRLRRDLREVFLIVVGVIIALTGNALWGYRQDRKHERDALQQLLETTRANEQRLVQALYEDSVAFAHTSAIWDATRHGVTFDNRRMNEALYLSIWFSDLRLLNGTYTSLAQTGDLNLLRNADLRADIARYSGEMTSLTAEWASIADGAALGVLRDVSSVLPYRELMLWALAPHDTVAPPVDLARLRNNPEFQSYLDFQILATGNRIGLLMPLRVRTAELRAKLENELHVAHVEPPAPDTTYHQVFVRTLVN
jgi:hypothetical protein